MATIIVNGREMQVEVEHLSRAQVIALAAADPEAMVIAECATENGYDVLMRDEDRIAVNRPQRFRTNPDPQWEER